MTKSGKWMLLGAGGLLAVLVCGLFARTLLARGPAGAPEQVLARKVVNGHYVRIDDRDELIYAGIRRHSGESYFMRPRNATRNWSKVECSG